MTNEEMWMYDRMGGNHYSAGKLSGIWAIVAVIVIFALVYLWSKNCNEKVQFSTALAKLDGRIDCIQPRVDWLGQQMYGVAQTASGLVVGVNDIKTNVDALGKTIYQYPIDQLATAELGRRGGCGNREFVQTQDYTLASTGVQVTERCRN